MSFPYTIYLSPEQELQTSSAQKLPLGTRGVTEDGRVFRYAQAGASELIAYKMVMPAAESSFTTATDQRLYYGPAGATDQYTKVGATQVLIGGEATHTIGGATVGMGVGSSGANDYKDGWLFIGCTSTGGVSTDFMQACRIHSHAALASSTALGSANLINLYPPGLKRAISTDTFISVKLLHSPYKKVIASAITTALGYNYIPVGVAPCMVTAGYYFWVQSWGPALCKCEAGARSAADMAGFNAVVASGGTGSFCAPIAASTSITTDTGIAFMIPSLGYILTAAPADNNYTMVMLTLAP